jgi:hypothetical protein
VSSERAEDTLGKYRLDATMIRESGGGGTNGDGDDAADGEVPDRPATIISRDESNDAGDIIDSSLLVAVEGKAKRDGDDESPLLQ